MFASDVEVLEGHEAHLRLVPSPNCILDPHFSINFADLEV